MRNNGISWVDDGPLPDLEELYFINTYPTAFPYGNGMVLHFYQQREQHDQNCTQSH